MLRNLCPNIIETGIFHITVNLMRILIFQKADNGILHLIGYRRNGIAQAEIIDLIFSIIFRHFLSHFKHFPNDGIPCHETFHRAC